MSRRSAALLLAGLVAASAITTVPASAAAPSPTFGHTLSVARAAAKDVLKQSGASSISLALVDGTHTVWSTTVGVVDGAGTKPKASTLYGIGSVSKMLATISVMQLVDAGKVSLDAPVTDYITDFRMASPEYRQITVRMLLNHSAGLPGTDYSNGSTVNPFPGYTRQMLDTLATQRLKTTPGSMSVYCNDCFTLAGIIVERMSGMSYADYVQQHIFTPLGMNLSRFPTTLATPGSYAPVLTDSGPLPAEILNLHATGGAWSTPRDMARLAAMLMNDGTLDGVRILSARAVKEMGRSQLPTTLNPATPFLRYGLGWDSAAEPGLAAVGVDGWMKGGDTIQYHASFTLAPDEDVAAIVVGAGTALSSTALETVAQRIVLTALAEKGAIDGVPEPLADPAPRSSASTRAQTADIVGIYLAQGSVVRAAADKAGVLSLSVYRNGTWTAQPKVFTHRKDGQYWTDGSPGSALRLARGWGRTYLVLNQPGGIGHYREDVIVGQKATSVDALSPAWRKRVGPIWLIANERPDSIVWEALPTLTLDEVPGLTGYLWVEDPMAPAPVDPRPSDDVASMFLVVPNAQGRDLNDLQVEQHSDGEWLRFGRSLYQPLASVEGLTTGRSTVTIGPEGYTEWRTVDAAGTLTTLGVGSWKVFQGDGALVGAGTADGADVAVPAGARVAFFGVAGAALQVRYTL